MLLYPIRGKQENYQRSHARRGVRLKAESKYYHFLLNICLKFCVFILINSSCRMFSPLLSELEQ